MIHPLVYELNVRCWLRELSERRGQPVRLGNVPESEVARWQELGFTHIWLMGVWEVGPRSRAVSQEDAALRQAAQGLLPDLQDKDLAGSPFAVASYKVARELGGESGLKRFRAQLKAKGLGLLLDFVPNHVGLDHAWVKEHPEWFVHAPVELPETVLQATASGNFWLAHGKDPNFLPWIDTVQLDYRQPVTRGAVIDALRSIAERCDGVRCDMAMLQLNEVFLHTWQKDFPTQEPPPATEFWEKAIQTVKAERPDFMCLAEAYWDLEPRLLALGFDYAYDKRLYDCVVARDCPSVQSHLLEKRIEVVRASAHFLENHDEARVASVLSPAEHRVAALLMLGLPGLRLLHEGQLTGARLRVPVQLARRPKEEPEAEVTALYDRLLTVLRGSTVGRGEGRLLAPRPAWQGNETWRHFVLIQWQSQPPAFDLVVVNLDGQRSQGYAPLEVAELDQYNWHMADLLGEEQYERHGDDLKSQGLYLDVAPCAAQLFHFQPQ